MKEMIKNLMRDTVKVDESKLPGICALDWELNQSSIFVGSKRDPLLTENSKELFYSSKFHQFVIY